MSIDASSATSAAFDSTEVLVHFHYDDLEPQYRGYSCPFEKMDEAFFGKLAAEASRHIVEEFLVTNRHTLVSRSIGLVEYLDRWCATPLISEESGRDPAFGDAFRTTTGANAIDAAIAATAVAIRLGVCGLEGRWKSEFDASFRFRWGDLLLPACEALTVSVKVNAASLLLLTGGIWRPVELARVGAAWRLETDVDGFTQLSRVGFPARTINLLPRQAVMLKEFQELVDMAVPVVDPARLKTVQDGFQLIADYGPTYLPWVQRALTDIFLLEPKETIIESGSVESYLGLIHLSAFGRTAPLAELLVHESSHQYFHALWRIGRFDDGSDSRKYWSPPVQRYRDLSRIAVAYHAFANILLFYRECLANGVGDAEYFVTNEARLLPELEQLEAPLRDNTALTVMGRALCEPLMQRVNLPRA